MIGMPEAWFNFDTPHKFWGIFPRLAYDIMTKEAPRRGGEWVMSIKYFQNVVDQPILEVSNVLKNKRLLLLPLKKQPGG